MSTREQQFIKNTFIGLTGFLILFFMAEGLIYEDVDKVVPQVVKMLFLLIMLIRGIWKLIDLLQRMRQWKRRKKTNQSMTFS